LIPDTQYLFSVAHNDQVYVLGIPPLVDVVFDTVRVANVQKAAFGSAKESRVVGYGVAFGWGIDYREHFCQVVEYELSNGQPHAQPDI
jgi:hypothetical protein